MPGDKLDEFSLAKRFKVSRTPIREALGQLVAMGLVDKRPNRGAIVAEVSDTRLSSMFEAMAELEGVCARLSAERMTLIERRTLKETHLASLQLVLLGAKEDYEAHNTQFHSLLYVGAHSEHLYDLVSQTRSRLLPFRRAQFNLPGRLKKSYNEHDAIVKAILNGDPRTAEMATREHVSTVSDASSTFVKKIRGLPEENTPDPAGPGLAFASPSDKGEIGCGGRI